MPAAATLEALGTGRRKTSVARVRIKPGSGKITVNDRELDRVLPDRSGSATPSPARWTTASCATRST